LLYDIHSHRTFTETGIERVYSHPLRPASGVPTDLAANLHISMGVHPWHAGEWATANMGLIKEKLVTSQAVLIGEIGLDNHCDVPYEQQLAVFKEQLLMAEEHSMAVLIHNVGHQAELLALKKAFPQIPRWVIHGFRGKPQMAETFLEKGFSLSFGLRFQVESLECCPLDKLYLETDDSNMDFLLHCERVARLKGLYLAELEEVLRTNYVALCQK
jgi:TatD DNase family protein